MNPKHSRILALVLALTLISWSGLGFSQMADDSDWWSLLKDEEEECSAPSKEKPSGANFVIAGVDLRQGQPIHDAEEKIAKTSETIQRGDAATSRRQICFKSAFDRGRIKLIFEEGEIARVGYLIDGGPSWTGSDQCVVSQKISDRLATTSGLRLGMTAAEVEKILGKPCLESSHLIEYVFDYRSLLDLEQRQRMKGKGDFDVDEPFDWFGTVEIKFREGKAYYLAILTGRTQ